MAYELNFASNPNENSIVRGMAIKKTIRNASPFTQDCNKKRQFWVKWTNNIISGGVSFTSGTKEVMRLEDKGDRYGKVVTLANVLTEPNDENAVFTFYPRISLSITRQLSGILCIYAIDFHLYNIATSDQNIVEKPISACM